MAEPKSNQELADKLADDIIAMAERWAKEDVEEQAAEKASPKEPEPG